MPEIRAIVVDIDGCLLPRGSERIDLSVIEKIREHNRLSVKNPTIPPVTICSGRPQPYVELLMKFIEGYYPAVFEWGAGLYIPVGYGFLYSHLFNEESKESRRVIRDMIQRHLVSKLGARIQPGKEVTITVYPRPGMGSSELCKHLEEALGGIEMARHYALHCAETHVDILPRGLDKGVGVQMLAEYLQIDMKEIAGIGDDESDLNFLRRVGFSACPDNARPEVKTVVHYVSRYQAGRGVSDILEVLMK